MEKYLVSGAVSKEKLELLFQLTSVRKEELKSAIHDHLVKGINSSAAAALNGIKVSSLNRALTPLNHAAGITAQINDLEWEERQKRRKVVNRS